jgi:hypothetical protein
MFLIYLSDLTYFSHVHKIKYENERHSPISLAYTRIGLGDPNNNSFLFEHCRQAKKMKACFHIFKESNEKMTQTSCYIRDISLKEIEDHEYLLNESLISEKTNNQVLMSKTNNFMPNFVDNLLQVAKTDLD